MNEKPSLEHLRIDRSARRSGGGVGRLLVWVLVVLLLLGGAGGAAWYFWPAPGIPVKTATAEAEGGAAGVTGLDATGYVVARRLATLAPKFLGKLAVLNVEEGQHITAGFVVARLDDTNFTAALRQAEAQQRLAKTAFDDATPIFTRYQRLHEQGAISTDAFENQRAAYDGARENLAVTEANVKVAETNLADTVIHAPYAGVITNKAAQVGEIVAPGGSSGSKTGIATLVDMDSLEVDVDVSENYIERVRAGGDATIRLDAYPDWAIPADVIAIIPTADQTKGTVKVRVGIKLKDPRILPEMGARVSFATEALPAGQVISHGVIVPQDAVKQDGRTGTVYVLKDDRNVESRQVMLGIKAGQSIVLLSGVSAGERLAIGDFALLHDGAKVTVQDQ
jgi:HlyD family secretion protein